MRDKLRLATVFSGIGAPEHALKKLGIPTEIVFACDNGEREIKQTKEEILSYSKKNGFDNKKLNEYVKDLYNRTKKINYVKQTYFNNYNISEDKWYEDVRFIDGNIYKNKVDLFVGGSPCQSFSNIGKRGGLDDARGTLFYDYARLIKEIEPTVFIYENVPGMIAHDRGKTWETVVNIFYSLGYDIYYDILNAKDYGIPQDRKRLFVVGFKNKKKDFEFPKKIELLTKMSDYLESSVDAKHYLGKKGFEFVTNPEKNNRARVNKAIIKTQKANQQFNWNGDFVFVPYEKIKNNKEVLARAYIGEFEKKKGAIRQLSYRECYRLMGFSDNFRIIDNNIHAYRQAGNSIVVNVVEEVIKSILDVEDFLPKIRLATVFSGIGAVEFALRRMNINHEIVFACDNGEREVSYDKNKTFEEIKNLSSQLEKKEYVDKLYDKLTRKTNFVEKSYLANYNININCFYQDVQLLDGRDYLGKVDLFVGGSPCQSFSSVGHQAGLDDVRGTLFYEYARLVSEIQPKVFIYENVRNLLNHNMGRTWKTIKEVFDSLGYTISYGILNAADYGIPQNRRRLFVVGTKNGVKVNMPPQKKILDYKMKDFSINNCSEGNFTFDSSGELVVKKVDGYPDEKYTLTPKLYNYVMKRGTKSFSQKPEINKDIARTLLKTMGNRHRAGIDNYLSFDGTEDQGSVRMLTEREAHRLMGFTDDYRIIVSRSKAYKQDGNSIVVDVLMALLREIINSGALD